MPRTSLRCQLTACEVIRTHRHAPVTIVVLLLLLALLAPAAWARSKRAPDAHLESAIVSAPTSAQAWLALARFHDEEERRAQAALCYLRALTLDPSASGSDAVASRLWEILVPASGESSDITMRVPGKRNDPWWSVELLLGTTRSIRHKGKAETMSDDQFFATGVEGLTVYIGDLAQDQAVSDFWRTTAIPYFREARDKGHVESMAYGNTFS